MKSFIILIVIVTSFFATINFVRHCNCYVKAINQCILMIENIEILISFNGLTIQNIFKVLSENKTYDLLTFIRFISNNMESGISKYVLSDENVFYIDKNKYFKKEDKDNLINFFFALGKSDLNGQITNCKTYKEIFKKRLENIEKNELKQRNSIGVIIPGVGFLIVVLLL